MVITIILPPKKNNKNFNLLRPQSLFLHYIFLITIIRLFVFWHIALHILFPNILYYVYEKSDYNSIQYRGSLHGKMNLITSQRDWLLQLVYVRFSCSRYTDSLVAKVYYLCHTYAHSFIHLWRTAPYPSCIWLN